MSLDPDIRQRLERIDLLLMDVDGVLTDGSITYSDSGEEIKTFNVKDGLGLRLLMDAGVNAGIITGRRSEALACRCRNLGITLLFDGVRNKTTALDRILAQTGGSRESTAFIGDDLPDLPVMNAAGLAIAVADAVPEVRAASHIITKAPGGRGAVREICEMLLKAKNRWDSILCGFTS